MEKKIYFELEYPELDALIEKTYGYRYEFVAYEELGNDSSKTLRIDKEPLNEYDQKDLDVFKATGKIGNWRTHILLTDMVNNGVLEPGNYLIEVSW